jgi:acyl-CoA thioester hydrolase
MAETWPPARRVSPSSNNGNMPPEQPPSPGDYPHVRTIDTRWKDNDVYGHVNNVEYYSFFDTVINAWLIERGGLDILAGNTIGVCAESSCRFLASIAFPESVNAGLRVGKLGNSSVRYEIGLFRENGEALAEGNFVHVFVDRGDRRPRPIPEAIRTSLTQLAPRLRVPGR